VEQLFAMPNAKVGPGEIRRQFLGFAISSPSGTT
jgi:hypothetical protein